MKPDSPLGLGSLGWAAYLACSWTWCIGMFLPVLLVRDFGTWGFVVFAVPNVLGAAAMGWVLSRAGCERIISDHPGAVACFSIVTIALHAFFVPFPIAWISQAIGNAHWYWSWIIAAGFMLVFFASLTSRPTLVAGVVLACSAALIACFLLSGAGPIAQTSVTGTPSGTSVAALAAVCALGFVLCPYLDATFLQARRENGAGARAAFSLGFGVFFLAMILFTLAYAPMFLGGKASAAARAIVSAHMLMQIAFTVGTHVRAAAVQMTKARWRRAVLVAGAVFWLAVLWGVQGWADPLPSEAGLGAAGENIYRVFMAAYGLVFPAYVLLCVVPARGRSQRSDRGRVLIWGAACVLAAPCYWLGFIDRLWWWLLPGVGIVLLAGVASRGRSVMVDHASPARRSTLHSS